jgi:hypothetical protein
MLEAPSTCATQQRLVSNYSPAMRIFISTLATIVATAGLGLSANAATSARASSTWTITPRQPALRLLVNYPCPSNIRGFHDVTNQITRARTLLVPRDPKAGLICRYGTIPTTSLTTLYALVRTRHITKSDAIALASAIDRVNTKRSSGTTACPAAYLAATVITFSYKSGSDADIWYVDSGCATIDNGYLKAIEEGNSAFFNDFTPLIARMAPRT